VYELRSFLGAGSDLMTTSVGGRLVIRVRVVPMSEPAVINGCGGEWSVAPVLDDTVFGLTPSN